MHPRSTVPGFDSLSTGKRYEHVNRVLNELSTKYAVSLWALDTVWAGLSTPDGSETSDSAPGDPALVQEGPRGDVPFGGFGLERQLEAFLVENWSQTPLSGSLEILTDQDGDIVGEQYPTKVGPIDLLCKNKDGSGYTVVELKRGQTSDDTVGQVARYMGWVKKNLVKDNQSVRGLIICRDADEKLMVALTVVPDVTVFTYAVSFALSKKD
jgi:hypothetical protein